MAVSNPVGVQGIGCFKAQGAPKAGALGFGVKRLRRNRLPSSMTCAYTLPTQINIEPLLG